ncbi:MAG: hypothetical protein K9H49_04055 [Bacteroidales bacterium]|nr:hypothetical protein [Bacteroidales bacterium]MCF8390085.1 hypothetical protein [Bacteroidales bacterium]
MNRYLLFSFYILILIIISCEYDPKGIYEREVDQNVTAPLIETINLDLSMEEDTIELMYSRVYFHFKSSDQKVKWVNFYINDKLVGTVESNNSYFDFNHEMLHAGTYRLKLELITATGTGSIAELIGMEGFVFTSKEWIIIVRDIESNIVTTEVSNGFLKLRFPRSVEKINEFIVFKSNLEIGRTSNYEFIDKGYVGEGGEYYIQYEDSETGELRHFGWIELPNEIEFKYTYDSENNYAIEWSNRKYYSAVDTIILFSKDYVYSTYDIEKTADISKAKFEIPKSYFGSLREYKLALKPKYYNPVYELHCEYNDPYSYFSSQKEKFIIGYPAPIFKYLAKINESEFIYHTNKYDLGSTAYNDSIFRYSITENKLMESFRYNPPDYSLTGNRYSSPSTSPDGNSFFAILGSTETAISNPTNKLSNYKIIDFSNLTSRITKVPISNEGTALIYGIRKIILFDYENDKVLGSIDNTTALSDYNISFDGCYFFKRVSHTIWLFSYKNKIISPEDTDVSWNKIGIDYFDFKQDEANRLVSWDKDTKKFSILSCPDLNELSSYTVNEEEIVDIDYFTGRILSFSPNLLVVRSLDDGSVLYKIPVGFSDFYTNACYLVGNSIFNRNGARYYLE